MTAIAHILGEALAPVSCGAKTRSGRPCRSLPVRGRRRCRMHGGTSPAWFSHPRWKHGRFSKYGVAAAEARQASRARARARVLCVVWRKVEEWAAAQRKPPDARAWLAAFRAFDLEHARELVARREAYVSRKI